MTKLEKLIAELCPNGVEFRKLGEVVEKVKSKGVSAKKLKELAVAEGGDVRLLSTGNFEGFSTEEKADGFLETGEVITIPTGGSASLKYHNGKFVNSLNHILTSKTENVRFIYHFMLSKNDLIESYFRGSGVKHPEMKSIFEIKIPVPPLEVQEEIVRILDKFTQLEAELEAELEARKKQYSHYRNALLSFENPKDAVGVRWIRLGEVFEIITGGDVPRDNFSQERTDKFQVPIISNGTAEKSLYGWTNKAKVFKPSITISARGTIGWANFQEEPFFPIVRLLSIHPKDPDIINVKFAYFFMKNIENSYKMPTSGIPQLTKPMISKILFPLPPLEKQKEIVEILDKFEKLTNDISQGLPAEITARRKQYEYYRNKLLTFNELP